MRRNTLFIPLIALVLVLLPVSLSLWGCGRKAGGQKLVGPDVTSLRSQRAAGGEESSGDRDGDREDENGKRERRQGVQDGEGFDPKDFVRRVDNPYFPLVPGTLSKYVSNTPDGVETDDVRVMRETRRIVGVVTTTVRDKVYLDGTLKEDTIDWYAQDDDGNVWYFGEDTKEFENGVVVSTEGTWLAGKDGAKPGIIMQAHPRVGQTYRQEFAAGVAEDQARVVSLNENVRVSYGAFHRCLKTFETTPLDPASQEFKFYARGVGPILTVSSPDGVRSELKSVTKF